MPTPTYKALATVTLAVATTQITFSNIPATYRDLIFVANGSLAGLNDVYLRINGDTASNYANVQMTANGSTQSSSTYDTDKIRPNFYGRWGTTAGSNNLILQIMDYSATDKHKTVLSRMNGESDGVAAAASRWANTAAVNSFICFSSPNIAVGTTFSLYGVIA